MYRETTRLRSFIALVFLFTYIAQSPCVLALRHPPVGNVCTAEEIANGQWVVHKPLTTLDEMRARYGLSSTAVTRCDPVGPKIQNPEGGPDYYDPDETLERTLAVASPELIPRSPGCKVLNPTRVQLIKRLLRSRNGLILVGDSLTEHQTQTIANFLHQSDELVHQEYSGIWGAKFWLNPDHPLTDSLLQEAGVAPTRLTVPLVSFWRHHHLLDWSEKAVVWKDAGSRYKPDKGREDGPDWFSLMIDQAHGHDLIRNKHVLEEPTFMLLNTGAHFARFELGWNLTESDFAKAFEKTIKKVEDKVAGASIPISATWRTMAPGHIDCDIQSIHDNNRDHWKSPTDDKKVAHNYNWFHWMNAVYKGGRRSERPPNSFDFMSSRMTTKRNPEFMVMDVWPMSVKRPDAHMEPPHDCLHWCRTGVQNYWNTLLIHMMLAESRNKDYGV